VETLCESLGQKRDTAHHGRPHPKAANPRSRPAPRASRPPLVACPDRAAQPAGPHHVARHHHRRAAIRRPRPGQFVVSPSAASMTTLSCSGSTASPSTPSPPPRVHRDQLSAGAARGAPVPRPPTGAWP